MTKPVESKRRGGRARLGTLLKTKDGRYQAQVLLSDGVTRRRLKPFPKGTSEAMARERTAYQAELYAKTPIEKPKTEGTPDLPDTAMGKWLKEWLADRKARGLLAVSENVIHYKLHIAPAIGPKHVRDWTKEDLRKLCSKLDGKVQAGELAWKSAINIWATATKMAGDAAESKLEALRCRGDNPADGVRGPDRGDEVGEQFLYPSEFLKFVRCEDVPLRWRRIVAVAVYLYPRDAELRALQCRDVDTEHLSVLITKSINRRTGELKSTKGRRSRKPTMEPAIVPLLDAIKAEHDETGPLIPNMPHTSEMARSLRRWLLAAGVDRHELHHRTPTTRPIRFHDLRATGITWLAIRGDDPLKIQHRAGHTRFETTQRYVRAADDLRDGFGTPFPELPWSLGSSEQSHTPNAHALLSNLKDKLFSRSHQATNKVGVVE